ncbi:NAD(P)-dependent oxidoreductase [Lacisediminihabitans profunda]|uniref:NAD(P)-dependent oxidoreductase n=1 Tax=Lacisediminihabitans profunda TaxID=2594790 RepID=A0A5C8UQZ9_9MICO|nr:NAD(P)-dependent oxidoreductase [Lacisediminihabitans profunda]TXN30945.1 NAD(P)-dependent oxidoreductase [Lacisediminihabitans profunda]
MSPIGWIGLGAMGAPMALVAAQSHDLVVFDVDQRAVARLAGNRITAAASGREAASNADVLVVMVATEAQVESVLFGTHGAVDTLAPGAVVVVMATVGPAAVQRWAENLAAVGISLVDAPVSGGVSRAEQGELLIMVSGSASSVQKVSHLLGSLARSAPVVGNRPGDGQKVKLVNQLLCGIHIAAAGEALAFAESLGMDARSCWEVVRSGAAASFMLDDRGERMLEGKFDDVRSAVDIFVKDMALVREAAADSGVHTPLAATAGQLYARAAAVGLGRKDDSVIIQLLRAAE